MGHSFETMADCKRTIRYFFTVWNGETNKQYNTCSATQSFRRKDLKSTVNALISPWDKGYKSHVPVGSAASWPFLKRNAVTVTILPVSRNSTNSFTRRLNNAQRVCAAHTYTHTQIYIHKTRRRKKTTRAVPFNTAICVLLTPHFFIL